MSLESRGLLIDLPSATWLVKDDEFVYAVLENSDCISSLRLSAVDGVPQLKERSRVRVLGKGPTHAIVAVDDRGDKHLIAANYGDGSLNVHPIDSTGCVGEAVQMLQAVGDGPLPAQEGPHAHWILPLPDGRVLSTDLGADRIYVHHWLDGKLIRTGYVSLAPGTGPRDLHLLPSNDATLWRVAVVCEWACTVLVLEGTSEKSSAVMQSQAVDSYDAGADRDDSDSVEIRDNTLQVVQSVSLGASDGDQAASLAFVPDGALPDMAHKTVVDSRVAKCGNSESGGAQDKAAALSHAREIDARHHCERQHSDIDQSGDGSKRIVCADGMAYIGLRGSDRIIPLRWSGKRFSRLADSNVPNWQGQGVSCGGGRPRQLLALGTVLLAANETSDNIAVFRISAGGRPVEVASVSAPSPTVMLVLD